MARHQSVPASVALEFADGTHFGNVSALDWVDVSELINFESGVPGAISVETSGRATLLSNHHARIPVSAQLSCASVAGTWQQTLMVAANLAAPRGDVDLGELTGLQFQQVGTDVLLPIYASVQGKLVNFQIEVALDTLFLRAAVNSESIGFSGACLLYTSPSPRDRTRSRMPSSA